MKLSEVLNKYFRLPASYFLLFYDRFPSSIGPLEFPSDFVPKLSLFEERPQYFFNFINLTINLQKIK